MVIFIFIFIFIFHVNHPIFRGASHQSCNLKMAMPKKLLCYFHGGKNYDMHHVIRELPNFTKKISVIANTTEKYSQIDTPSILFRDSYSHLNQSLSQLAENLKMKGIRHFKPLFDDFPNHEPHEVELLLSKMR